MIGHMGIADSSGVIYDFGGPYFISEDRWDLPILTQVALHFLPLSSPSLAAVLLF